MSDSRTRIWFSLFVLAVFCLGLAAGVLIGRRMGPRPPRFGPIFERFQADPGRGGPPELLIDRLERQLALTPDQRTKVEAILRDRRVRLEQLQGEIRTRTEAEQRELREEMKKILTPPQQARFEDWLAAPGPGRRGRGPGPGRGGPF